MTEQEIKQIVNDVADNLATEDVTDGIIEAHMSQQMSCPGTAQDNMTVDTMLAAPQESSHSPGGHRLQIET